MSDPVLIILSGLPGSGKTTLARALAKHLGAVHVRIDSLEQAIERSSSKPAGEAGYVAGYATAEDHLRAGRTVIADSVNPVAATRHAWRAVAARCGATAIEIEIVCSDAAEHRRRVETRPDAGALTWHDVVTRAYEPWDRPPAIVDTAGRSLDACLRQLIGLLPVSASKGPAAESALVILVPEAEALVKPFRERYDRLAAAGVPAHITLLYPFLPPDRLDGPTRVGLGQFFARQEPFGFSLAAVRRFVSPIPVLYLVPDPATRFAELTLGLAGLYPKLLPYGGKFAGVVPHLTVAQAPDVPALDAIAGQFAQTSGGKLPIAATASEVALLDNQSGRWETRAVFALGRVI